MENYEKLLDKAYEDMPESYYESERFEIPNVRGHLQGNKTIISNFIQICSTLRRKPNHVLKYLLKALGAKGELKRNGTLIFNTKLGSSSINDKIKQYAKEFVICSECGKPDTEFIKEKDVVYLKCHACGSKKHIKTKI